MARLALATAGYVIGNTLLPGIGGQIGWTLGSALGGTFEPNQKSAGPRLGDLSVSGSAYGTPIPYVAGSPRISGQIIWTSAKREIATTTTQGKGGGGGQEYTSYTYEVDLLLLLSDNQISGLSRIWSNGTLVWSALNGTATVPSPAGGGATLQQSQGTIEGLMASGGTGRWSRLTVYGGGPGQLPDPTYEAAVGTANAPAYRGRGTVFIQGLQLGSSGQLPNLTFELANSATGTVLVMQHFENPGVLFYQGNLTAYAPGSFSVMRYSGIAAGVGPSWNIEAISGQGQGFAVESGVLAPAAVGESSFKMTQTTARAAPSAGAAWVALDSSFAVGASEDFTVEVLVGFTDGGYGLGVYASNSISTVYVLQHGAYSTANTWSLTHEAFGGGRRFAFTFDNGAVVTGTVIAVPKMQPVRVGVSRQGTTLRLYYDGVLVATSTSAANARAWTGSGALSCADRSSCVALAPVYGPGTFDEILIVRGAALFTDSTYSLATGQYADASTLTVASRASPTVKAVVDNLLLLCGLTAGQVDTTALASITTPVRALAVAQVSSVRAVLQVLAQAYNFEAVLSDKIYFRLRGAATVGSIPFADLGCDGGDPIALRLVNELEVPAQLAITYANIDNDHQTDTQYSDRLLTGQESTSATQLPLSLYPTEAKAMADAQLMDKAIGMTSTTVAVGQQYAKYEPCDVLTVADEDANAWRLRIVKKSEAAGTIKWDMVLDDATVFTQTGATSSGTQGQSLVYAPPATSLLLLDIPLLQDSDNAPGHYFAVTGSSQWQSAALYKSSADNNYTQNQILFNPAVFGLTVTALAAPASADVWDEVSTVRVSIANGQLSSATRDAVLASTATNAALIGTEVVQYRTATLVGTGLYDLSGLLRGRRGTQWAMASHTASETFCVLGVAGMGLVAMQSADLGKLWYYKAASAGVALSKVTAKTITPTGLLLKPFAPVDLRVNRVTTSTVFTWKRCTRLAPRFTGTLGINVPLGETSELYDIEFYSDASYTTLKRTYSGLTSPTATYTSANQVTDFGANQTDFYIRVYQVSAVVGRGYALQVNATRPQQPDTRWLTRSAGGTMSADSRSFTVALPQQWARSAFQSSGKRYFEVTKSGNLVFGLADSASNLASGSYLFWGGNFVAWETDATANVRINAANNAATAGAAGAVLGIAIDLGTGMVWTLINGVATAGNPVAGTGGYTTTLTGVSVSPFVGGHTQTSVPYGALNFASGTNALYTPSGFTGFLI
jgi:hypothetical protein